MFVELKLISSVMMKRSSVFIHNDVNSLVLGLYHAAVYYYQKGLEYPPAVSDVDSVSR